MARSKKRGLPSGVIPSLVCVYMKPDMFGSWTCTSERDTKLKSSERPGATIDKACLCVSATLPPPTCALTVRSYSSGTAPAGSWNSARQTRSEPCMVPSGQCRDGPSEKEEACIV